MRNMQSREDETMRERLDRVGAAVRKWAATRRQREAAIAKLAAGPPWYHTVTQTAAPEGAFFMELTHV
jgi:hypothetical protein